MVCEVSKKKKNRTPLCNNQQNIIYKITSHHPLPINRSTSIPQRHPLNPIHKPPPAIRLQLRILDPLLRPVLMRPGNPPNHALEKQNLVPHAFFDKHAARVLVDDRLFVLD
jgi:hypothetical protein